jgi:hypothetical protein
MANYVKMLAGSEFDRDAKTQTSKILPPALAMSSHLRLAKATMPFARLA